MPGVWVADVLTLLNIIQHSGVTPHAWHIDLMHYVYKGGEDSSLPNHRPLTLVDVLRKVFSSVSTSRMRRDWTRLRILDTCNPGFEPGRSTVNAIYPLRMAAEQCLADEEELVAFLDDLKWCFDMPAQVAIELALLRLAVPAFYHNMLGDIDVHTAKTTITAAEITADLLRGTLGGGFHRQQHGTGQGTIDGPQKWIAVAGMAISVARAASTAPVALPVDADKAGPGFDQFAIIGFGSFTTTIHHHQHSCPIAQAQGATRGFLSRGGAVGAAFGTLLRVRKPPK